MNNKGRKIDMDDLFVGVNQGYYFVEEYDDWEEFAECVILEDNNYTMGLVGERPIYTVRSVLTDEQIYLYGEENNVIHIGPEKEDFDEHKITNLVSFKTIFDKFNSIDLCEYDLYYYKKVINSFKGKQYVDQELVFEYAPYIMNLYSLVLSNLENENEESNIEDDQKGVILYFNNAKHLKK